MIRGFLRLLSGSLHPNRADAVALPEPGKSQTPAT